MGDFLYARTLINADALAAYMFANKGTVVLDKDGSWFAFNMDGFDEIVFKIVDERCG